MHHHELECYSQEWLAIFKVKVTARTHIIKIWQFLLYFLNCRSFRYQTMFGCTLSQARVCCEEIGLLCIGLLHSRSRSQQGVEMSTFIQIILSKPPNILLPNLVLRCIIVSWSVMQKDLFAIFKVKVTAWAHNLWSEHDSFSCLFWTADPFATKLCLKLHYR